MSTKHQWVRPNGSTAWHIAEVVTSQGGKPVYYIERVPFSQGEIAEFGSRIPHPDDEGRPVAYLRDAHEGEGDECLVPAAKNDPGSFPVYLES